jgi:hypothetical protein
VKLEVSVKLSAHVRLQERVVLWKIKVFWDGESEIQLDAVFLPWSLGNWERGTGQGHFQVDILNTIKMKLKVIVKS